MNFPVNQGAGVPQGMPGGMMANQGLVPNAPVMSAPPVSYPALGLPVLPVQLPGGIKAATPVVSAPSPSQLQSQTVIPPTPTPIPTPVPATPATPASSKPIYTSPPLFIELSPSEAIETSHKALQRILKQEKSIKLAGKDSLRVNILTRFVSMENDLEHYLPQSLIEFLTDHFSTRFNMVFPLLPFLPFPLLLPLM